MELQHYYLLGSADLALLGFSVLAIAVMGVMQLIHAIATMTSPSKQDDENEQLALKFSHRK
jgi:hypothetical protein